MAVICCQGWPGACEHVPFVWLVGRIGLFGNGMGLTSRDGLRKPARLTVEGQQLVVGDMARQDMQ